MLTKNPFATPSPTPPSVGSSMTTGNDPNRAVKRWQLEYGRTRKRVEDFSSQLDAARQDFAKISIESVADDRLDITAVSDAMTQASEKVQALEVALNVATQREKAAEASLKNAEMEARREALREKLSRLTDAGRVVDERIAHLAQALNVVCPLMDDARAIGFDLINLKLKDAQDFFRQWLLDSCGAMPGCRTGRDVFVKRGSWAETLPQPDQADHVRLTPYPETKPIPGWQIE